MTTCVRYRAYSVNELFVSKVQQITVQYSNK